MGEEWGAASPFPFFCDFGGELADAVRAGRRREFSAAYAAHGDAVPDPLDEATFRAAQLDWSRLEEPHHRARLMLVRELLAVRHAEIVPRLNGCRFGDAHLAGDVLTAQWQLGDGSTLHLVANLSERDASSEAPVDGARRLWGEDAGTLAPWAVRWSLETR
jgi:maltooligosyltrehalose trehalohydrolase